MVVCVRFEDII